MLKILFENNELLIIDKPAGLSVQPGAGIKVCFLDVFEKEFGFKPFLVHRLDKETSGCLVVAKSSQIASGLSDFFNSHDCIKKYRAIVSGSSTQDNFEIKTDIIIKDQIKKAKTMVKIISRFNNFCHLELELGTGRTHQIRIHLAKAGLPILGDDKYGNFALNRFIAKKWKAKRLMLYSSFIRLPNGIQAYSSVPPHFKDVLEILAEDNLI